MWKTVSEFTTTKPNLLIKPEKTKECSLLLNTLMFHTRAMVLSLCRCIYSFSQLLKHIFWKHASFSQNSKHKSQNHSHKMQNPLYLLQNATLLSKQCYVTSKGYFVFQWQTQPIIWVDILSIDWTLMCSMENTTMNGKTPVWRPYQEHYVTIRLLL